MWSGAALCHSTTTCTGGALWTGPQGTGHPGRPVRDQSGGTPARQPMAGDQPHPRARKQGPRVPPPPPRQDRWTTVDPPERTAPTETDKPPHPHRPGNNVRAGPAGPALGGAQRMRCLNPVPN